MKYIFFSPFSTARALFHEAHFSIPFLYFNAAIVLCATILFTPIHAVGKQETNGYVTRYFSFEKNTQNRGFMFTASQRNKHTTPTHKQQQQPFGEKKNMCSTQMQKFVSTKGVCEHFCVVRRWLPLYAYAFLKMMREQKKKNCFSHTSTHGGEENEEKNEFV